MEAADGLKCVRVGWVGVSACHGAPLFYLRCQSWFPSASWKSISSSLALASALLLKSETSSCLVLRRIAAPRGIPLVSVA